MIFYEKIIQSNLRRAYDEIFFFSNNRAVMNQIQFKILMLLNLGQRFKKDTYRLLLFLEVLFFSDTKYWAKRKTWFSFKVGFFGVFTFGGFL